MELSRLAETSRQIALIDCQNFYASCEAVFSPSLADRPVVVLSNNDGCCVAANDLARRLDPAIMGKPWFQLEAWAKRHGVVARSSNYELYGSLSRRVTQVIARYCARIEPYSIDECFVEMRGTVAELTELGRLIRADVLRCTGLPVRVAIAPTKTLAKVMALGVKRSSGLRGVGHFGGYCPEQMERILASIPVGKLWGVARRSAERLAAMGVYTAKELRDLDLARAQKKFSVVMARTILELRGVACLPLEEVTRSQDQLMFSRSFARKVTTSAQLEEVLVAYAQRVSSRLRAQGALASYLGAWARTSWVDQQQHAPSISVALPAPTDDPILLGRAAKALLSQARPGVRYARAGITLSGLVPAVEPVLPQFDPAGAGQRRIGEVLDEVTGKLGEQAIGLGRAGLKRRADWEMKRQMLSRRATTHWAELAVAHAR